MLLSMVCNRKIALKGLWFAQDYLQPLITWNRLNVSNRNFTALAGKGSKPPRIMIDATHLKAHHTAASLLKKEIFLAIFGASKIESLYACYYQ